jgi:putative ABC transport system permease protein
LPRRINLNLGDRLGAIINGRWQQLQIVGLALSPEYVYEVRGAGNSIPTIAVLAFCGLVVKPWAMPLIWMARLIVPLKLMPGAIEADVIDRLDHILDHYGSLGAYGREDQISHSILKDEISGLEVMATMMPSLFLAIAAFLIAYCAVALDCHPTGTDCNSESIWL